MVEQGIILVGNPPVRASGLTSYPESDKELGSIVQNLWGSADGENPMSTCLGKEKSMPEKQLLRCWR